MTAGVSNCRWFRTSASRSVIRRCGLGRRRRCRLLRRERDDIEARRDFGDGGIARGGIGEEPMSVMLESDRRIRVPPMGIRQEIRRQQQSEPSTPQQRKVPHVAQQRAGQRDPVFDAGGTWGQPDRPRGTCCSSGSSTWA